MSVRTRLGAAVLCLVVVLRFAGSAHAQITFTYEYNLPSPFSGSIANPGYYSQDRRDAIARAGDYIASQFDGRGTVGILFGTRTSGQIGGSSVLASAGTFYFSPPPPFSNGLTFQQATANNTGTTNTTIGDFNSDQTNWWTGIGSSVGSGQTDMQSVALHEIGHSLGFASLIQSNGSGLGGTYSRLDNFLRLGSAANAPRLINPNGTFNSAQVTTADLAGNNIYFHGELAMAVNGGLPIRMATGSRSHVGDLPNAVMLPNIGANTDRRAFQPVELAMLIDMGWNQFLWGTTTSATSGNWADNVSSLSNPRWQNVEADSILSPVGTITTNLVLTFNGNGSLSSTNNLILGGAAPDRFLVNRIILNNSAGTSTIAATGSNTLRFNTTIGVTPLIRQDNAGAFTISHPIELTNANLQLGGNGTGRVTLSGPVSQQSGQTGGLTKLGTSTFVLSGNNTYTGVTTVSTGTLLVNNTAGSGTGFGAVMVNQIDAGNRGTLGGTGQIAGVATVQNGGTIRGGDPTSSTNNALTLGNGLTTNSGATIGVRLITLTPDTTATNPASNSFLNITGGTTTINSLTNFLIDGSSLGFSTATSYQYRLMVGVGDQSALNINSITTPGQFTFANFANASSFNFTVTGNNLNGGEVFLDVSPVPEPAMVLAVAAGGFGLSVVFRRIRRRETDAARETSTALGA
jgi:autotransporter-associated beta strand protein